MNYLLISPDPFPKDKAINEIKSKLFKEGDPELNINTFYADADPIEEVLITAGTMPFNAPNRLVIVRNAVSLPAKDLEALKKYFENPPKETTIIFDIEDKGRMSKSWQDIKARLKVIDYTGNEGSQSADQLIRDECGDRGKEIDADACQLLKGLTGVNDLGALRNEIMKLDAYTGQRRRITKSDVENIVGKTYDEDVFAIINMIRRKDAGSAIKILDSLLERNARPHEILGLLAWHIRKGHTNQGRSSSGDKQFRERINMLIKTDELIKRSRLKNQTALETAVIELCENTGK